MYGSEPLTDALLYEPVPYRSALKENCTHVLVLRTRADNVTVTAKMGVPEKLIMSRYFGRKQGMPEIVWWMHNQFHKLIYAEDVLFLNAANQECGHAGEVVDTSVAGRAPTAKLFCVALPSGELADRWELHKSQSDHPRVHVHADGARGPRIMNRCSRGETHGDVQRGHIRQCSAWLRCCV